MSDCLGCCPVVRLGDAPTVLSVSRVRVSRLLAEGVLAPLNRVTVVGTCRLERAAADPLAAHELRLRALLLAYREAAASHESAAALLGMPLLAVPRLAIATRARGAWRGGSQSRIRIAPLPAHHLTEMDGMRCTQLTRTVVDIARCATMREAVVPGDAALRGGCSLIELLAMLDETAAWSDIGKPRKVLQFLDPNAESPLESVSRVVFHENDLPAPSTQVRLSGSDGASYRVDFYWPSVRLVGEADGMTKYDDPQALRAEKIRQERLEQAGYRVVRWGWQDITRDTATTIARIRRHLEG